ncbi:MAG: TonB family protein [Pseudomonadota bacterium]|nr:TonB family protein [Pseudomonadota bacterium]
MSAAATSGNITFDRGARFSGAAPAKARSCRLRAGIAASSLLAHGCLVLTFVFFDPAANSSGRKREIPVEVVTELLVTGTSPAASSGSKKSFGPRDAAQAPPATASQKPDIDANPKPENEAMSGPNPVAKPAAPAPAKPARKAIVHEETAHDYRAVAKPAGGPARRGGESKNRLPAQAGLAPPFDSGRDSFRAVAVPLASESGGEAMSYRFIVGGMLERVKHYPEAARQRGAKGIANIGFVLDESGRITSVSLLRSSSEADLDAESVALVRRAAPFPPPPPGAQHSFAIEVAFGMGS